VLGDEYLRDWQHLRAGEVWDDRLRGLIEEADVFQLFWSRNAMASAYVRREWEHAMSLNRPCFVRPTYWEEPLPEDKARGLPPAELLRLHFQRIGPLLWCRAIPHSSEPVLPDLSTREVLTGQMIPGYKLRAELGRGGMGTTYRAWHEGTSREVVVKIERADVDRWPPPGTAAWYLNHPGIVPVLDDSLAGRWRYRVEPFIEGISLTERLRNSPLSVGEAAEIAARLAEAVHYAHTQGVYHFNLKPDRVLLKEGRWPVITGFGRFPAHVGARLFVTPAYMAPEQACGHADEMGSRTDVYGLGAVLYECLTGTPPFRGGTAAEVLSRVVTESPEPVRNFNAEVPPELESIVMCCLAKWPEQRYASAEALARHLTVGLRRFKSEYESAPSPIPAATARLEAPPTVLHEAGETPWRAPVARSSRNWSCAYVVAMVVCLVLLGALVVLLLLFR
jgi:hypothetical protein